jgi:hypothetical protein
MTLPHRSLAIKNWLVSNGFCLSKSGVTVNQNEYADVLERFYLSKRSDLLEVNRWEKFVQEHFEEFKYFVINEDNLVWKTTDGLKESRIQLGRNLGV